MQYAEHSSVPYTSLVGRCSMSESADGFVSSGDNVDSADPAEAEIRAVETDPSKRYTRVSILSVLFCVLAWLCQPASDCMLHSMHSTSKCLAGALSRPFTKRLMSLRV